MILNILTLFKTGLYISLTKIEANRLLVFLVTSLITISWMEFFKRKGEENRGKRLFIYGLFSIILFADSMYYSQFGTLPSIKLLKQVGALSAVQESVYDLLDFKKILLILDLPVLIILFFYVEKVRREGKARSFYRETGIFLIGVLCLGFLTGNLKSLKRQEVYLYHLGDLAENILGSKEGNAGKDIGLEDIEDLRERARLVEGKHTGLGRGKNLIVLQVEAGQDFVLGLEYDGTVITPELNKLIEDEGTLYFSEYHQLVGRGNTSDAEFVSHNSLHPAMDESSYSKFGDREFYGLPQILRDEGYRTIAMHGYEGDFWNRRTAYKGQGFDEFKDMSFYQDYEKIGLGVSDRDFFKQNVDYLREFREENEEPFYAFMVSLTSHTPFNMPEEHKAFELRPEHEDTMLGRYLQSIHWTDRQIGFLIEELKEAGLYEDTVIAIYGDHFAVSAAKEDEARVMTDFLGYPYELDEMMHIPLIIHLPGEEIRETVDTLGSQIDFLPTILNIMGYENKKGLIFGRDLLNYQGKNFVAPQTYMAKGSFIEKDRVFVISRDGIFENSRAYNRQTKEAIEIENLRESYERAIREINLSDYILNKGIFHNYLETGEIELGKISREEKEIRDLKKGTEKELDKLSKKYDYIGLNLREEDGVLLVDSDEGPSLEEVLDWRGNKEINFVLKTDDIQNEEEVLIKAYENYDLEPCVAEIKVFDSYLNLSFNRYKKIVLNHRGNYGENEILEFLERNPEMGISIGNRKFMTKNIRDLDVYIYK